MCLLLFCLSIFYLVSVVFGGRGAGNGPISPVLLIAVLSSMGLREKACSLSLDEHGSPGVRSVSAQ